MPNGRRQYYGNNKYENLYVYCDKLNTLTIRFRFLCLKNVSTVIRCDFVDTRRQ